MAASLERILIELMFRLFIRRVVWIGFTTGEKIPSHDFLLLTRDYSSLPSRRAPIFFLLQAALFDEEKRRSQS